MKRYIPTALVALLMLGSVAFGQGFRNISAEELKKMVDGKNAVVIVDARVPEEYATGHIPGAINVPPDKTGVIDKLLPGNKGAAVVVYCKGGTG